MDAARSSSRWPCGVGQSARWTDEPPVRVVCSSSARKGQNGARSSATVTRQWWRVAWATGSAAFQNRGRLRRTYQDRKSVGEGKGGSVRVGLGGRRTIQKKKTET